MGFMCGAGSHHTKVSVPCRLGAKLSSTFCISPSYIKDLAAPARVLFKPVYFLTGDEGAPADSNGDDLVVPNPPPDGGFALAQKLRRFPRPAGAVNKSVNLDSYPAHGHPTMML